MIGPTIVSGWSGSPYFRCPDAVCEPVEEIFIHGLVDDNAVDSHADLALVEEFAEDGRLYRVVQFGVAEDDKGRVSAEFQFDAFHDRSFYCLPRDLPSDGRGACKRDHPRNSVKHDRVANLAAGPDEHAHDAGRQSRLFEHPSQQQAAGDGRVAGRLHDDSIAHCESGRKGARGQVEGPVPRADNSDNTYWLPVHAAFLAGNIARKHAAFNQVRHARGFQNNGVRGFPFQTAP